MNRCGEITKMVVHPATAPKKTGHTGKRICQHVEEMGCRVSAAR